MSSAGSEQSICGAVCATGRLGEPLACGFKKGHKGNHAWASQPTWSNGIDPGSALAAEQQTQDVSDRYFALRAWLSDKHPEVYAQIGTVNWSR